uniref:Uncharacterized protein n=1 Tax=Proboscia inermis TaxID=420281 RepID=A0A7S0CI88_9STRA|mmetsp:Transcript_28213/g.34445  ORF Transcript_28213/g.34445 Transcript_28213/m.34445 type:complete len:107 (+) Transcript_28213:192-512(+)|eukprot:CAMPEP_0171303090 /NCGR_PEP_ID=MMETSP0816-20121228/12583_1 /TAXON_ID=420281 /ORGANISM="Proboscia inermis, Strain CCAP1064/1" /LENGTH=106 /DNA_ID=CAMNT_0011782085 /DNA_START=259 /DNA_END=579 /DNA_ORIENTATION=+
METDSNFFAFTGTKAIENRKAFASKLRSCIEQTDFQSVQFLRLILDIVGAMNKPCLRLELLQYILGLDNRYSVAHVARSVQLASTCMDISMHDAAAFDALPPAEAD